MLLSKLRIVPSRVAISHVYRSLHSIAIEKPIHQQTNENKFEERKSQRAPFKDVFDLKLTNRSTAPSSDMVSRDSVSNVEAKESIVLSFDDVPGPKSLKYLSFIRRYLSEMGTQFTAGALTFGFHVGSYLSNSNATKKFSSLFDEYGPVVRFISPVGSDIVLLNNPKHIERVFNMEGEYPVRSTLDSLERYRTEYRSPHYTGLLNLNGEEWYRQREATCMPLDKCLTHHLPHMELVTNRFTDKVYKMRNYQDEVTNDLYKEIHKWAFECMGHIIFAKTFNLLDNDTISNSQCDMTWFYHSLEKASEGLMKCESGMQLWRIMPTPAWNKLVKYCDSLDNLIGKQVVEAERKIVAGEADEPPSLMNSLLERKEKLRTEAVTTILMDMMLLGVNTVSTTATFLLYHLAKYQRAQKVLYNELQNADNKQRIEDVPYLNACLKESLRLVPPIPVISRVLPRNIVLDKFNIPSGTLVIMSMQDTGVKESNFDDALRFYPERWLTPEMSDCHEFAYIPFGFGARKCLGKEVAEAMLMVLVKKMLKRFKLEYHYGDILPTRTFISKPNRQLKLRLMDRF